MTRAGFTGRRLVHKEHGSVAQDFRREREPLFLATRDASDDAALTADRSVGALACGFGSASETTWRVRSSVRVWCEVNGDSKNTYFTSYGWTRCLSSLGRGGRLRVHSSTNSILSRVFDGLSQTQTAPALNELPKRCVAAFAWWE